MTSQDDSQITVISYNEKSIGQLFSQQPFLLPAEFFVRKEKEGSVKNDADIIYHLSGENFWKSLLFCCCY